MTAHSEPFWVRIPHMLIGTGTVENNVATLATQFGSKKVLILTDPGVVKAGLVDKVKQPLAKERVKFEVFDKCEPDAPENVIRSCAQALKDGGHDLMISIGGGSTMDTGKLASILATADDVAKADIAQYVKGKRGLPKIHIQTTAGTSAEATMGAVWTDETGIKRVTGSPYFLAQLVIIDPLMTLELPAKITADTGMDALTHAIESYCSKRANIVTNMISEMAMKLIADNLRTAYHKGSKNPEARYNMAVAAGWACIPFITLGGPILPHGMGHSLQTEAHCSHGVSVVIMLPYVMEFNIDVNPERYARIAELMGEKVDNLPVRDAAQKAVEAVRKLSADINMPQRLRDIGVKKEQIPRFVDILFTVNMLQVNNNPRECTREDATRIFEAAW